jgi:hypothetical protein
MDSITETLHESFCSVPTIPAVYSDGILMEPGGAVASAVNDRESQARKGYI